MIVRAENGRLRLHLQTDHARLAGEFAANWGGDRFAPPSPLAPVRLAAEVHDDGWFDWERQPRILPGSGRPVDFLSLMPDEHIPIYEQAIELALAIHPYAGLLVSLHGTGLYQQRYGHMPELTYKEHDPLYHPLINRYLAAQEQLQEQLIAELQPAPEAMWTHYRWLQAWDLLSLFICLSDPAERTAHSLGVMPHRPGGPAERLVVQGAGEGAYTVTPWPFAPKELELILPVRYVPNQAYESDEAYQTAFAAAPTEALPMTLRASL